MPSILKSSILESRLTALDEAISLHPTLEIDSDFVESVDCVNGQEEAPSLETHKLKIINHDRKVAYAVSLQSIMDYSPEVIIEALETGILRPLFGVTRIVGYYSRISNWNKSKLGELRDRHRGNYSAQAIKNKVG